LEGAWSVCHVSLWSLDRQGLLHGQREWILDADQTRPASARLALFWQISFDPGGNPKESRLIARTVKRGAFLAIEGARHLPNVEDAELFSRIVIDWRNKHT